MNSASGHRRFAQKLLATAAIAALSSCGALTASNSAQASPPQAAAVAPVASAPSATTAPAAANWGRPASLADLVEQVSPAVVQITATGEMKNSVAYRGGQQIPDEMLQGPFGDFFRRFFDENGPGAAPQPRGRMPERAAIGSGFIINEKGIVVTNNHVVDGADKFNVKLKDGREFTAKLVGVDDRTDLAVLKLDTDQKLPLVKWGDSDRIRVGDSIFAVGAPFGLSGTVTSGIVSARGREIGAGPYDDFIQIDAPINQGNSGGPLFDAAGNVIGVNSAIVSPSGGNVGIGFAIPADMARPIIEQIVDHGSVERGWLGVSIQSVSKDMAASLGLKKARGAIVGDVQDGSPASRAGIRSGDVIVKIDGKQVDDNTTLSRAVANTKPGATAKLTIIRNGKEIILPTKIDRLKDTKRQAMNDTPSLASNPTFDSLGLALAEDNGTIVVSDIDPDSNAASIGLQEGDVIVSINQKKVSTVKDAEAAIKAARKLKRPSILAQVQRNGQTTFVAIPFSSA